YLHPCACARQTGALTHAGPPVHFTTVARWSLQLCQFHPLLSHHRRPNARSVARALTHAGAPTQSAPVQSSSYFERLSHLTSQITVPRLTNSRDHGHVTFRLSP